MRARTKQVCYLVRRERSYLKHAIPPSHFSFPQIKLVHVLVTMSINTNDTARNTSFSFLDLARELRDKIYRELLVPEKVRDPNDPLLGYKLHLAIIAVSKQTKEEAKKILYGENNWVICTVGRFLMECAGAAAYLRLFTKHLECFPGDYGLRMTISYPDIDDGDDNDDGSNDDGNYLTDYDGTGINKGGGAIIAFCDLQRLLDVLLPDIKPMTNAKINLHLGECKPEERDQIFDILLDIRGFGKASITGAVDTSKARGFSDLVEGRFSKHDDALARVDIFEGRAWDAFVQRDFWEARSIYQHALEFLQRTPFPEPLCTEMQLRENYLWMLCNICSIRLSVEPATSELNDYQHVFDALQFGGGITFNPRCLADECALLWMQGLRVEAIERLVGALKSLVGERDFEANIDAMGEGLRALLQVSVPSTRIAGGENSSGLAVLASPILWPSCNQMCAE